MCGIAGIFQLHGLTTPEEVGAVRRMMAAQVHRGPDADGVHYDRQVVLGHRRLAIIDLSSAARQPMSNEDATVWIAYNGEIYNHRELRSELITRGHIFTSQTDTEVIIHGYEEWGIEGLLERLRGMFAFALYDARPIGASGVSPKDPTTDLTNSRLILARDRFGIKPLYYQPSSGDVVVFASEVKALLRSGRVSNEPELDALSGFLLLGSVPSPLTTVQGVRCLPPGHFLVVDHRGMALHRYWDVGFAPGDEHLSNGETVTAALRARLEDTVARHLVSDVPLGIFLSGGVDSAALTALASRAEHSALRTLTVVFEEKEFSEAQQARQMAARFRAEHREVLVTSADFMRELPRIFAAMDQPTNDGVNTYFVSKAARQSGLTVVLSGLGGDEVFWGYRHYHWLAGRNSPVQWVYQLPSFMRQALVQSAAAYGRFRGQERWMRFASLGRPGPCEGLYSLIRGFFAPQQVAQLLGLDRSELHQSIAKCYENVQSPATNGSGYGSGVNYIEIKRYLHDQLLRDADTFSMAHSIEVRVPYLDHTIVEYAAHLPSELKLARHLNKPLLIDAVGEPSLTEVARAKKKGFTFPFGKWMRQHADALEDIALGADVLDREEVHRLWQSFRAGRLHWSRAWALVVLGTQG
jgi:asparagine synthase (glutamine-hydrolysing)